MEDPAACLCTVGHRKHPLGSGFTEQLLVGRAVRCVTVTCPSLQSRRVEDHHVTTVILYQVLPLQRTGGCRDANAAYTQHIRQELMRDPKPIGARPIASHQQQSGQALVDLVKSNACRRGGELRHQHVQISIEDAPQRRRIRQQPPECNCADAPCLTTALYECVQGCCRHSERQLYAQHSLVADHADFEYRLAVEDCDQRDEPVDWKIDVVCSPARPGQHLTYRNGHPTYRCKQAQSLGVRQQFDQAVRARGIGALANRLDFRTIKCCRMRPD